MDRSNYHSHIIMPFLRDYYIWPDNMADRYSRAMHEAHQMVCTTDVGVLGDMRAAMPNVFDMAITYSFVNPYVTELTESWVDNLGFEPIQTIVWKNARQVWLNDLLDYIKDRMNRNPKYRTYDSEVFAEFFKEFKSIPGKHRNEFIVTSDGVLLGDTLAEDAEFPTVEKERALSEVNG